MINGMFYGVSNICLHGNELKYILKNLIHFSKKWMLKEKSVYMAAQ